MVTYEEFVAARLPAVLRYATALTGSPVLAEDVVQEVMVRVQARRRRISAVPMTEADVERIAAGAVDLPVDYAWMGR